jgi:hypothetical protein
MKYFSIIFLGLLFIGCNNQPNENKVFFGGEIINPKSDVVLLMQHKKVIDSLFINKDNTFGKYIPNLSAGLYYFKHAYEFQYLYLEPEDSISIRLNTWDFDETLVFDGNGADKNELLLDLFLSNEKEVDNFYTYFPLSEEKFQSKINETLKRHTDLLNQFVESNPKLSNDYLHLAEGAINYPIFRLKELYPFYHKKNLPKDSIFDISADYYQFRDKINLNDSLLSDYYTYQNYISAYLYNSAYQKNNSKGFDDNFRAVLLELITEKIHLPELKNRLLYQEINNMLFNGSCEINPKHLELFFTHSTDTLAIRTIKQILKVKEKLKVASHFQDFNMVSFRKDTVSIHDLIKDKNTVVYFISPSSLSDEYLRKRVYYLRKKYPELTFVGIHPYTTTKKRANYKRKLRNQYFLTQASKGNELVVDNYSRAILIDSKGKVVNNYTILTNRYIEEQLSELVNQNE